jgi:hypothetical protein
VRLPYTIRRKRRVRIPLSFLWEAVNPKNWDVFAPTPDPNAVQEGYRRWGENRARARRSAERGAGQSAQEFDANEG